MFNDVETHKLQNAIVESILHDFETSRSALLKAGQRGGKGVVSAKLIVKGGFENIALISSSLTQAKAILSALIDQTRPVLNGQFYAGMPPDDWDILDNTLIIIDEAMWIDNSYELYASLFRRFPLAKVFVTSSRGPSYDADVRWQAMRGYSATSWDLNPSVVLPGILNSCFRDPVTFIRDYCGY